MSTTMATGACAGCGSSLPPLKAPGRPRKWCSERCRKASYGDPCVDCGARTRFGAEATRVPEPRCASCAASLRTYWTPERIIDAIREWDHLYGEPPAMHDWNSWSSRHELHDEARATRFEDGRADRLWPYSCSTVVRVFGSWNAAIEAAGFCPRAPHGGGGNIERRRDVRRSRCRPEFLTAPEGTLERPLSPRPRCSACDIPMRAPADLCGFCIAERQDAA